MKNATLNRNAVKRIAQALNELNEQVIFVGGAAVGFYANDPSAEDVRPTKDIDISLSILTFTDLEIFREELIRKGFIQTAEDNVICRFRYHDIMVDVMNTRSIAWAPANPWFAPGFPFREPIELDGQTIRILPLPYFLATKFSAYNSRGKEEPRNSHDFEDIVFILDNCYNLADAILNSNDDVKSYLKEEFTLILSQPRKQEAIMANLSYLERDQRYSMIMDKLGSIVQAIP